MTTSQGLRNKGPNTPYETLKTIEEELRKRLAKQADGRWKYPPKENDETLAKEIGNGATLSAVRKMRISKHPGGLVIQQIIGRTRKSFVYPNAGQPSDELAEDDIRNKLAALASDFDIYRDEQEVKYRALWNLIDQRTAPTA